MFEFIKKVLYFPFKLIERRETLTICVEDGSLDFYLSEDLYISVKLEEKRDDIYKIIKNVLKNRSFELYDLVGIVRVKIDNVYRYEKELLDIVTNNISKVTKNSASNLNLDKKKLIAA